MNQHGNGDAGAANERSAINLLAAAGLRVDAGSFQPGQGQGKKLSSAHDRALVPVCPQLVEAFAFHAAPTLSATKGRLIRCTVPTATPNRAAILRTPSVRPGAFKAAWIRFSTSGATLAALAGPAPHFVQHHSSRRSCSRARLRVSFSLLSKQANIPPNAPNHATPHASPAPRFLARAKRQESSGGSL